MDNEVIRIRQLRYEWETWKRDIEFMMRENAYLKDHLAEMINVGTIDRIFLKKAEEYQDRFIQQDEYFKFLRREIKELEKLPAQKTFENNLLLKKLMRKHKILAGEIVTSFAKFNALKSDFNNYLNEHLIADT